ncbi:MULTISPECIES: hypothetical protein [unclassified Kitasatospora]|uniref:hypothetical protein n=1 Tax=unclassified Kitasatospora TaxID=2633591 RepID=UPI0012FA9D83|nr:MULTISPECIES: hypothetical protein [unclassified Kitasatospora]
MLAEVDRAAVERFLSAVDVVMNSNTVLLKVGAAQFLTVDDRQEVLRAYLRSDLFEQMMFEVDCRRQWYLLSNPYAPQEEDHVPVRLLRDGFGAVLAPLGYEEFAGRLRWMLREAYSPYGCHKPAREADVLVADFVREMLAPRGGGSRSAVQEWEFASVEPDFLRCTEYYTQEVPLHPVYFDGSASDTATLFHRGRVFYLLLTNGSP